MNYTEQTQWINSLADTVSYAKQGLCAICGEPVYGT